MTRFQKKVHQAIIQYEKTKGRYPRQIEIARFLKQTRENLRQHLYRMVKDGHVEKFNSKETIKYTRITFGKNWQTEKKLKEYTLEIPRYKAIIK